MEIRSIVAVIGLLASAATMAQAYRWVDAEGVVHYSDRPAPGAERVQLPEYKRSTSTPAARASTAAASADAASQPATTPFRYESLSIASPAPEETLWNIGGVLNVSLALTPALQEGHQVRVYFDGTPSLVEGQSFQIQEVYRGVHNIQAEVLDATGRMMIRSVPNRFYVQQNTVITRQR